MTKTLYLNPDASDGNETTCRAQRVTVELAVGLAFNTAVDLTGSTHAARCRTIRQYCSKMESRHEQFSISWHSAHTFHHIQSLRELRVAEAADHAISTTFFQMSFRNTCTICKMVFLRNNDI
jgi:hypothetical protein